MDALKLNGLKENDIIFDLFKNLSYLLERIPVFKKVSQKIVDIHDHVKTHPNALISNRKYREKLVDHLYDVFNEFQETMK